MFDEPVAGAGLVDQAVDPLSAVAFEGVASGAAK
jgi:hypothetical protein